MKTFTVRLSDTHEELMDSIIALNHERGKQITSAEILRASLPVLTEQIAAADPKFAADVQEIAQRSLDRHVNELASKLGQNAVIGLVLPSQNPQ